MIAPAAALLVPGTRLDPPLDPSGDEARGALRRELARPEYHDTDLVDRVLRWLDRLVSDAVGAATDSSPVTVAVVSVVLVALAGAVAFLVSRARVTARGRVEERAALGSEVVSADELRARAEASLAAGDASAALVDAFRAVAVRQVERERIEDLPQATAHELAAALGAVFPERRDAVLRGADLFDEVHYGERPATAAQARDLLDLDDALGARAVRR